MLKGRRRKPCTAGRIMIICSIAVLNLMGIGYSYWSTNLNIEALVRTGELDVQFSPDSSYELVNGSGDLSVSFIDPRTISIEGTVEEAVAEKVEETDEAFIYTPEYSNYEGHLWINIVNRGKMPAKLSENIVENEDGSVLAGTVEQDARLNPEDESSDTVISQEYVVTAGAEEGSKTIDFTNNLLFDQPD